MKCDFHLHTIKSDGSYTPSEVVELKAKQGIDALAITDHDTIDGLSEAQKKAQELGVKFVSGIEISSYAKYEMHILGYGIEYTSPDFLLELAEVAELRRKRVAAVIKRLDELNMPLGLTPEQISRITGRLEISKLMIAKGYASSINEAFDNFLGDGKPAHIEGCRLAPYAAVKLITKYGGIPVLAHPARFLKEGTLELILGGLIHYGLKGLECYYPTHNETETKQLLQIANKYKLIATCGSDFHAEGGYLSSSFRNDLMDACSLQMLLKKDFIKK